MPVQVKRVGVPLIRPVGHQHCVPIQVPLPEVAVGRQEVTQEGRVPTGQEHAQVERVGPVTVARPLGTDHSRVAQQPVRDLVHPHHVPVLVHPAVFVQHVVAERTWKRYVLKSVDVLWLVHPAVFVQHVVAERTWKRYVLKSVDVLWLVHPAVFVQHVVAERTGR